MALRGWSLGAIVVCVFAATFPAAATTFTVNSTADTSDASPGDAICDDGGGACTLRAAIEEANANAGADTIHFAIGSGAQTIAIAGALPAITEAVTLDATTQGGYAGVPLITLDGATTNNGLQINTSGCTVRGLAVTQFLEGIAIQGGSNNVITENAIYGNASHGVVVYENASYSWPDFTALTPDQTLVAPSIDFTDGCGSFRHSAGAIILDMSGRAFNENFGMRLTATLSIATAGSYTFTLDNIDDQGRLLVDSVEVLNNTLPSPILSNSIALSAGDHTFELAFWEGGGAASLDVSVSGPGAATFTYSGNPGLFAELFQGRIAAVGNTISENSIYDNGEMGIALSCCCRDANDAGDTDIGPNTFLNYPVFTSRVVNLDGTITIDGTATANAIVEIFGSTNDGFGYGGEGKFHAGSVTADGSGNFSITITLPQPYYSVTSTATDTSGNTSEFSDNFNVRPRQIVVTNANDTGPGSLRAAINEANGDGVPSLITFDPSLANASIAVQSPLPTLNENGTTINGDINNDCLPDVEVRANDVINDGLTIFSNGNTIRGLAINRFLNNMITIDGSGAQSNEIRCNHLGLNLAGTAGFTPGTNGVVARNNASANLVANNRIAALGNAGVLFQSSNLNDAKDNVIGLAVNGTPLPPNYGIQLMNVSGSIIGSPGLGNRIVAGTAGCQIQTGNNLDILANTIGWPANTTPTGDGIVVQNGSTNVRIGSYDATSANTITNNGGAGVRVLGSNGIEIRNNSISNNGGLGIDLDGDGVTPNDGNGDPDTGANNLINFPVLTRAATTVYDTQVEGFLDTTGGTYDIHFFVSNERDPSGYGEGATASVFHATLASPGSFSVTLPLLPAGAWLTATTTDTAGNTSEFSLAREITGQPLAVTELVAYPVAGGIALRWRDPNASETGFRIERVGFTIDLVANVGPDVTTWTDTGVSPGNTYNYRVIATSPSGDAPPSNMATATAYSTFALKLCKSPAPLQHNRATSPSVAFDGTNGAIAFASQSGGRAADIFFQRLNANGSPMGSALQITNDDVPSTHPTLVWNGTNYGLLWLDHLRAADGRPVAQFSFAFLGPTGAIVRGPLRVTSVNGGAVWNEDDELPLLWDGSGWGIFTLETISALPDVVFYRLDEDGDVVVNGSSIATFQFDASVSAAWNGSEYGIAWRASTFPFDHAIWFARMLPNGTLPALPVTIRTDQGDTFGRTSIVWDGANWAIAWAESDAPDGSAVYLRRISPAGVPLAPAMRISDAPTAYDVSPELVNKPGGGFIIFTTSSREVGRLEADANGVDAGSLTLLSPDDGLDSMHPRAIFDGTSFLLAWGESRVNPHEIADAVVSVAGVPGTVFDVTTDHGGTGSSTWPSLIRVQNNAFAAAWTETYQSNARIDLRIHQQNGGILDFPNVNPAANPARRVMLSSANGFEIALLWTDRVTGGVHFDRVNSNNGMSFIGGGVRIADADVDRGAAFDFDGEEWGVVWVDGGALTFQRMGHNTPIGVPVTIAQNAEADPKIQWIGSGHAIVWKSGPALFFARVDRTGALIVPPIEVTADAFEVYEFDLRWTGQHLGIAWSEWKGPGTTPGIDVFFTVLNENGFKQFAHVAAVSTSNSDRDPALYFDGTNFRVVYPDVATGLREVTVTPQGAITGTRFLGNHAEGRVAVAYNGATLAMAWEHMGELLMQTTECLADASAPVCPTLNGTFANGAVQVTWPVTIDPQSGTIAYHLYRDGRLLTELRPNTTSFADSGYTPGASHTYELRTYNGAYLEATGCTPKSVTAGIVVSPSTLPNGRVGSNYNQTIAASQGTSPYSFAVTNGSLPPGLTLGTNGSLTGNPTNSGQFQFTVTATDNVAATGARTYLLRICNASFLMPTVLPDPIVGTAYQQTLALMNGGGPHAYAVTSGSLPPGLTLSANGTLSGTPTTTGPYNFTITATENSSCTTSASYSVNAGSGREPRDVAAQAQSNTAILVRWVRPQKGETGFRIERSFDGGNSWGSINIVGADVTSHLDQGLTPQVLVHYRVVALYGAETATSAVAAAITFPHGPTNVCQQPIGPYHARAQQVSVVHDGTRWAAAWADRRDGRLEDIYFQFLDDTTAAPTGSPVPVTQTDMQTRFPTLRWNGTHFGVLYSESMRGPDGESASTTSFALLDGAGTVLRTGVRIHAFATPGFINSSGEMPLEWDGAGWGTIVLASTAGGPTDLYYRRLAPNGDVITGPVQLTSTAQHEFDVVLAWNGSEYGIAWITIEGTTHKLWFARMQVSGTLAGAPILLDQTAPNEFAYSPSLVWSAGEWAVAWSYENNDEAVIRLRRLNPDGTPKGPAVRLSDDLTDPEVPPLDFLATLQPKSGGGYFAFPISLETSSSGRDVARLEADASGNRVGSRVFLTATNDGVSTLTPHTATDGTRFLIGLEQNTSGQGEAATLLVDASGNAIGAPVAITSAHTAGSSGGPPLTVAMGANFGAIWTETSASGTQIYAKFFDGGGNLAATRYPLGPSTTVQNRIAATAAGQSFAAVWRDSSTNTIRFRRFDNTGNPLIAETDVTIGGGSQPGIAWNGEHYGVAYFSGNLRFQRVASNGSPVGPAITIAPGAAGQSPLVQWVDRGWAIVWRSGSDLMFTLLDRNGAFLVAPLQFTFTTSFENNVQVAWSGDRLGVVWREMRGGDPPGDDLWFTALRLDGTKAFSEFAIVSSPFGEGGPGIYWDLDRFRVVYGTVDGTRELAVQSDGTVLPGDRILHNRTIAMTVAFNGTSLGMFFNGPYDLTFQTSSCLGDVSAPSCPNVTASFDGQKVRLTWPAVGDPQSGIGAYDVYRDGAMLAELRGDTLLFDDYGFVSGATHVYEVRAVNRALKVSTGCTTRTVVAGVAVNPPSLANGSVNTAYNATFTGSGGTAPYTFAVTAGALPPGLALNANSGALTGTPVAAGLYTFTITATDALAQSGSRAYTIRVCAGLALYPTVLADGSIGNPYSQTVVAANATGGVSFTLSAGTLPAGLTLDTTGWIHGSPTALGTLSFTVAATDSIGCSTSRAYTILIGPAGAARNLSATALSSASIRLRWIDPQRNENGFRIERSTNLGASWSPLTIVGANATTFTDSALTAATTYSYRVVATTPGGDAPASNLGTATTFPSSAAKTCFTQLSPYHAFARPTSVVRAGSQWAMVWQDRKNDENDEIWFSFLDANGVMTGTPLRLSNNESASSRPVIQWNGTKLGVMWVELLRGPNGELHSPYRFALLDASGNVLRNDVRIAIADGASSQNSEPQFFWDGSAWSFVEPHAVPAGGTDLMLYRFDEDGDPISGPVNLNNDSESDFAHAVAWNGSEYAIAWVRGNGANQTAQFRRFSSSGAPLGPSITINDELLVSVPDVVATPGGGWAVTWSETADNFESPAMMRRFDAEGNPIGAPTRLSDPMTTFQLADFIYDTIALPSGGYAVLTRGFTSLANEVGFIRADASGNRIGSRAIVSPADSFISGAGHFAYDGTNFLVTFNEGGSGTQEIGSVVVNASGGIVAGPTALTSGHSPGNGLGIVTSGNQHVTTLGGGFVTTWNENVPGDTKLYARIVDATGAVSVTKFPLTTRGIRGRGGVVSVGSTFAVAFRDATNAIAFCRYDAAGNALMSETTPVTSVNPASVFLGFDGENYGMLWVQGQRLQFQRVAADGTSLGARSTLPPQITVNNAPVQMTWTGSGWAIAYVAANDVHFLLLDATGAVITGPVRVSFTPDDTKNFLATAWNGDVLGIAYAASGTAGPLVRFTVVGLDGIKAFNEIAIAEGTFGTSMQGIVWANDRFRVFYQPAEFGTFRELDFSVAGAQLGTPRMVSNRGGNASVAWNGVTAGILWNVLSELHFQTSECLTDTTPPACPSFNATRTNGVTLTWSAVSDAQSGIYHYYVWRDGKLIGETSPNATSYVDAGVRPGDQHTYRVSAANGAYLESPGCSTMTLLGLPSGLVAWAPTSLQVQIAWQPVDNATEYQVERSTNGTTFAQVGTSPNPAYTDTSVAAQTSYLYRVRAVTPQQVSAPSNVDVATTMLFTNDPLAAGIGVKAVHVTELRTAVNSLRALAQLAPATYSGTATTGSMILATNVLELRTALNQARAALALSATSFTNTINAGSPVRAIDLQELRNAVK